MPQEMNILRCSSCKMFQVHIVKKAKKWQCKLCNFKQTISQVYFQGSGKDCRIFVQQLNLTNAYEVENSNECSDQPTLNVAGNMLEKFRYVSNDISMPATSRCPELERGPYVTDVDNDDESYSQSQSECVNASNESVDLSNVDESFDCDKKTELKNVSEEMIENASHSDDDKKDNDFCKDNTTEMKCAKNIFESNDIEDIDFTIDY